MAYNNWDEIIASYRDVFLPNPRYEELARGMLSLIPLLRVHEAFADLIPSTSHEALCLTTKSGKKIVYVGGNNRFVPYAVSICDLEIDRVISESFVDKDMVVQTIEQYVEQLRQA